MGFWGFGVHQWEQPSVYQWVPLLGLQWVPLLGLQWVPLWVPLWARKSPRIHVLQSDHESSVV